MISKAIFYYLCVVALVFVADALYSSFKVYRRDAGYDDVPAIFGTMFSAVIGGAGCWCAWSLYTLMAS